MAGARALRATPLFQALSATQCDRLLKAAQPLRVQKGQTLFRQGDRAGDVWLVLEGWVHLVRSTLQDGSRAVVLFTITPRETLCGVSALELGTYTASGIAGTASEVLRIPAEAFVDAMAKEPAFALDVLHLYGRRIRHMAEQYGTIADSVSRRIIRTILRLVGQFGMTIPVTHRELAQMSWTTTESAIRAVRSLKRLGVVEGSRGRLTVRRVRTLEELLRERR